MSPCTCIQISHLNNIHSIQHRFVNGEYGGGLPARPGRQSLQHPSAASVAAAYQRVYSQQGGPVDLPMLNAGDNTDSDQESYV